MPNLAAADWIIVLIYFFFAISIALSLRQYIHNRGDYLLAGRSLPAWLCGFALAGASLGSMELLGMGAAGARYGMASASFFGLGSILPLLFAALFVVPAYYRSQAASIPGYLRLRFDGKTRALTAILSIVAAIVYAALSLYVLARVGAALGLFNMLFHAQTLGSRSVFLLSIGLPAAFALILVLLGGLGATMYTQVMQFFLLVAGMLPVVLLGSKQIGGWTGMKSAFDAAAAHTGSGLPPSGFGALALATALGIVLTAGYWCTDFGLLQSVFAAQGLPAARRGTIIAAAARVLLPILLVVPGIIALGLPTPHTTEVVHNDNGAIYHEIDVVPRAAEQGQGLIPARTDSAAEPVAGNILRDAHGHPLLNYDMATANLLPYNLPTGLLGLGIAVLLACLVGGVSSRIAAVSAVFTYDLWGRQGPRELGTEGTRKQGTEGLRDRGTEETSPAVARWAVVGTTLLAAGVACALLLVPNMPGLLDLLALVFAVLNAPLLATVLLGVFWKRATGHGAFAGLLAGIAAALLHYGITVPAGETRGVAGGWIAALHHPPGILAQNLGTALCAILANLLVTVVASLLTAPRANAELATTLYAGSPAKSPQRLSPAALAGLVILASLAVSAIFF